MKERLVQLLKVKSIVTITTTGVFAFLSVTGKVSPAEFLTIAMMVFSFYFGTQAEKRGGSNTEG